VIELSIKNFLRKTYHVLTSNPSYNIRSENYQFNSDLVCVMYSVKMLCWCLD